MKLWSPLYDVNNLKLLAENHELKENLKEARRYASRCRSRLRLYEAMKALMYRQNSELITLRRRLERMTKIKAARMTPSKIDTKS